MFHLFSDIFTYRDNLLTGLDARVKLVTALAAIVCVVMSDNAALPAMVFVTCMGIMVLLQIPARVVVPRLVLPLGIVAMLFLLRLFMTPGEALWTARPAGLVLTITVEGVRTGALLAARVAGAVSMVLLLGLVTPAHDVFRALLWMRAPHAWVEIAMLMYRYIFVLLDAASDMATAQKLRLGYGSPMRSVQSIGVLSGAVLLRSVDQAERTNEAMILRGYNGAIPVGKMPPLSRRDLSLMLFMLALLVSVFLLIERVF